MLKTALVLLLPGLFLLNQTSHLIFFISGVFLLKISFMWASLAIRNLRQHLIPKEKRSEITGVMILAQSCSYILVAIGMWVASYFPDTIFYFSVLVVMMTILATFFAYYVGIFSFNVDSCDAGAIAESEISEQS